MAMPRVCAFASIFDERANPYIGRGLKGDRSNPDTPSGVLLGRLLPRQPQPNQHLTEVHQASAHRREERLPLARGQLDRARLRNLAGLQEQLLKLGGIALHQLPKDELSAQLLCAALPEVRLVPPVVDPEIGHAANLPPSAGMGESTLPLLLRS
jgi:hypothetical protein